MCRQMVDSFLPDGKALSAEPAPTVDVASDRFPIVHKARHLAPVHKPQMLSEMVLAIESPGIESFVLTLTVIMTFHVVVGGVERIAINTLFLPAFGINDCCQD